MDDIVEFTNLRFGTDNDEPEERLPKLETTCIPGHLASPINGDEVDFLLTVKDNHIKCRRHKIFKQRFRNYHSFRELKDPITSVQNWIKDEHINPKLLDKRKSLLIKSLTNWRTQRGHYLSVFGEELVFKIKDNSTETINEIKLRLGQLDKEMKDMLAVEKIKDKICFKEIVRGEMVNYRDSSFERDLSAMMINGVPTLFPTTLVLCALDKLQSLYWLKVYWLLSDISGKYPGRSILAVGSELYNKFFAARNEGGQDFFSFIASWESLVVGWTVNQPDDLGFKALYETQSAEMKEFIETYNLNFQVEDLVPTSGHNVEVTMFLELTGMAKILGYPTLESHRLLDQLKQYGTKDAESVDFKVLEDVEGIFVRNLCLEYRKKWNKYPNFAYVPEELGEYLLHNKPVESKELQQRYNLWARIEFAQTLEFDTSPDLSELTKDSAAAVSYYDYPTMYDRCAYHHLYNKEPPAYVEGKEVLGDRSPRRVIDAYLKADEHLMEKLLKDRENNKWNKGDHIVVQCGKELEQKPYVGRAFTKQTANQRFIQVVLESNVASGIFPYVKNQTMTSGELSVANQLLKQIKALGGTSVFVCMDLKKWCLHQRMLFTSIAARRYDQLFGKKGLYTTAHPFYIDCNIFCNSRFSPPDFDSRGIPIPGPFFMNQFFGGFEGMNQKPWTHLTGCVLELALEMCGLEGYVLGQGDNQVVIIIMPPHLSESEMDEKRRSFLSLCELLFKAVNHELKVQETWYSKHLHEYGKQRVYKGETVSQGTKKASKLIPDINDGLFSYHSSISTLNTMTESIAKHDNKPDVAFIMNQMLVTNFLHRKEIVQESMIESHIQSLLYFPADFGGLPLSTYFSHNLRGHDDPLTLWIDIFHYLKTEDFPNYQLVCRMIQVYRDIPTKTYEERVRLYEDPYCLPIKPLPSAESEIKKYTLVFLQSDYVTNRSITRLYDTDISMGYMSIIRTVDQISPSYVQLGHALLKNSNAGIGKMLQQKLTSSKTIETATKRQANLSLVELIFQKNLEMTIELRKRINRFEYHAVNKILTDGCSYSVAHRIRMQMWNKTFIGLTKPIVLHQVKIKAVDDCSQEELDMSIIIKTSEEYNRNPFNFTKSFGPFKPYIGSSTKEKIVKPTIDVASETSYTKGLKQLGKIQSWLKITDSMNLVKFCDDLIKEKKKVVMKTIDFNEVDLLFAKITSGNMFHRLSTGVEHSYAMVNGPLTQNSHFQQSSNNLQTMTRGGEDYSIFFQLVYSFNISALSHIASHLDTSPKEFACIFHCPECTHELPKAEFDLTKYKGHTKVEPLQPSNPQVDIISVPANLNNAMAIHTGLTLAENIDANFVISHSAAMKHHEAQDMAKTSVSINDFKRLDIKLVLLSCFTFSNHCRFLLEEGNSNIRRSSNDLSFSHLAELFIESDLRGLLFGILGRDVPEHTMITRKERLSSFISMKVRKFLLSSQNEIKTIVLGYMFSKNNPTHQFLLGTKILNSINRLNRTYGNNRYTYIANLIFKRMLVPAKMAMQSSHLYYFVDREDVVRLWRSTQGIAPVIQPVVIPLGCHVNYNVTAYSFTPALNFWDSRALTGGVIKCNSVGFLARPLVLVSSAINKYLEIIMMLGLHEWLGEQVGTLYSLAEGSGGTFTGLLLTYPKLNGAYNTWMSETIDNRDCVVDKYPPAFVASGLPKSRLVTSRLAMGETNILSLRFKAKLRDTLNEYRCTIATLDPESMVGGNNIEFISVVKVLLDSGALVIILKMFWSDTLYTHVRYLLAEYTDYSINFVKPTSSSPLNLEVFLCLTKLGDLTTREELKVLETTIHNKYLGSMSSMSEPDLNRFIIASDHTVDVIKSIFPSGIPLLGTREVDETSCSLSCINEFGLLINLLDSFHSSNIPHTHAVVFRKGGLALHIERAVCNLLYLSYLYFNSDKGLGLLIARLSNISINEDAIQTGRNRERVVVYQANSLLSTGNFWEKWGDSKFFLRDYRKTCNCTLNKTTTVLKSEKMNLFSWKLADNLVVLRIIPTKAVFNRFYNIIED